MSHLDSVKAEGPALPIAAASLTDRGCVRSENQDSYLSVLPTDPVLLRARGRIYAVADGMGGAAGGETASRLVVETIAEVYYGDLESSTAQVLEQAVTAANARVYQVAQEHAALRGMGSTCTVLAIHEGVATIAHVGDTRAYLVRDRRILQLTDDHTKVAQLARDGLLTPQQARVHPERNVILRSLGPKSAVAVDVGQPVILESGDVFVLCSDGLTGHVSDVEILELVETMMPDPAAEALIDLAKQRGGEDNVTVQIVRVGGRPVRSAAPVTQAGMAPYVPARPPMGKRWIAAGGGVLTALVLTWLLLRSGGEKPATGAGGGAGRLRGTAVDARGDETADVAGSSDAAGADQNSSVHGQQHEPNAFPADGPGRAGADALEAGGPNNRQADGASAATVEPGVAGQDQGDEAAIDEGCPPPPKPDIWDPDDESWKLSERWRKAERLRIVLDRCPELREQLQRLLGGKSPRSCRLVLDLRRYQREHDIGHPKNDELGILGPKTLTALKLTQYRPCLKQVP